MDSLKHVPLPGKNDPGHELYRQGDKDAPDGIKDRNGEIVLCCCRVCGEFEAGLEKPCTADKPVPANDRRHLEELAAVLDRLEDWCKAERHAGRPVPGSVTPAVADLTLVYRDRVNPEPSPTSFHVALAELGDPRAFERADRRGA